MKKQILRHRLNIKLYARALEEGLYETEREKKQAVGKIGEKTVEIEKYVEEIMRHTREEILDIEVSMGEFYLEELVEKVMEDYEEKCFIRKIKLTVGTYDNRLLKGDLDKAKEVFENDFNHIFDSFFRAANSEGKTGNGLGLYICRYIMQKMEGGIYAECHENGMSFVLVFA